MNPGKISRLPLAIREQLNRRLDRFRDVGRCSGRSPQAIPGVALDRYPEFPHGRHIRHERRALAPERRDDLHGAGQMLLDRIRKMNPGDPPFHARSFYRDGKLTLVFAEE